MKKKLILLFIMIALTATLFTGCTEADRVSTNISKEADNFNVIRRLSVINTRTDEPLFELIAAFSLDVQSNSKINIVCEVRDGVYKKHIVGLNEWTMYLVEDVSGAEVRKYHYEVNILPEMFQPFTVTSND